MCGGQLPEHTGAPDLGRRITGGGGGGGSEVEHQSLAADQQMAEELQAAEEPGEQEEQEEADRQLARTLQFQADDIGVGEGGEGIGEEEQKGEPPKDVVLDLTGSMEGKVVDLREEEAAESM